MEVQSTDTILEVDAAEWDALSGGDILATHKWLVAVEQNTSENLGFRYFILRSSGRVVAAASCQTQYSNQSAALDTMLYGSAAVAARRIGFGATPALVVGSRFAISDPFLFRSGLSEAERAAAGKHLLSSIVNEAESAGATVIIRNSTNPLDAHFLVGTGFQSSPEMPTAYIDIKWDSVRAFKSDLKKLHFSTEKAIRQQAGLVRRGKVIVERVTDPALVTDDMHTLLDNHYRRLNGVPFPFGPSFPRYILETLQDRVELTIAREGTRILGVNVAFSDDTGRVRSMMIGIDRDRGRDLAVYFVLLNNSMSRAIESRSRRLYYGRMLYDLKLRRGCSLATSTMWIRGRTSVQRAMLRGFITLRSRKLNRMIERYAPMSAANARMAGRAP
jgi:predicted N-acyltransferase